MTEETKPHKRPGRPKGIKNKPKAPRVAPSHLTPFDKLYTPEQILEIKEKVLELFEEGAVINLSEAATLLMVPKRCFYIWARSDKEWAAALKICDEFIADLLERSIWDEKSFIPRLMLLKGKRPKYKDAYRPEFETSDALEKFLKKLEEADAKEAAKSKQQTADVRNAGLQPDARTATDS